MPRTGSCSRCGRKVSLGPGSTAAPVCQPCRREQPAPYKEPWMKTCPQCGNEFNCVRGDRKQRRYCSNECAAANGKWNQPGARSKPERPCENCGQPTRNPHFCSYACRNEGYAKRGARGEMRGGRPSLLIRGLPRHVVTIELSGRCEWCQREFILRRGRGPKRKTCSEECTRRRNSQLTSEAITRRYHTDMEFRARAREDARNREVRLLDLPGVETREELIAWLRAHDGDVCGWCDEPIKRKTGPRRPSVDHIIPRVWGGGHCLVNLQLVHFTCNCSKNDYFDEMEIGKVAGRIEDIVGVLSTSSVS